MQSKYGRIALAVLVLLIGCGAPTSPAQPDVTTPPAPTTTAPFPTIPPTPPPSATPQPTKTPLPTSTPLPEPEPTPRPSEPVVLATITGTGAIVTDNYDLPMCGKAVFIWTAIPSSRGTASLIFRLYNVDTGADTSVVNEFETDVPSTGLTGMTLQPLQGGTYYFASENTEQPWTVRIECQDGMAPVDTGTLEVQGTGNTVTDNYELPACAKSVFSWETEPNQRGTASMIAYLCTDTSVPFESLDCKRIANVFQTNMTGPLNGQSAQRLSGGLYYLYVYNLSGPWSIRWECGD